MQHVEKSASDPKELEQVLEATAEPDPDCLEFTIRIPEEGINFKAARAEFERELVRRALTRTRGDKSKAAKWLSINRTTLLERMKALGFVLGKLG